jgi:hypothetical protein
LDRLGRNAIHLNKLFGWCGEHDKTVVSCSESIDLGNWAGRMLASVIAGLAEGELEAIRERQRSSRCKLRETARWAGGKPPFGYTAVKRDDGKGWSLEVDPLAGKVIRRIVDDVLHGKPVTRIARELTDEGYRTPVAYYAVQKAGRPTLRWAAHEKPSGKWATTALRNMLRSKALRGCVQYNGETVRDADSDCRAVGFVGRLGAVAGSVGSDTRVAARCPSRQNQSPCRHRCLPRMRPDAAPRPQYGQGGTRLSLLPVPEPRHGDDFG